MSGHTYIYLLYILRNNNLTIRYTERTTVIQDNIIVKTIIDSRSLSNVAAHLPNQLWKPYLHEHRLFSQIEFDIAQSWFVEHTSFNRL